MTETRPAPVWDRAVADAVAVRFYFSDADPVAECECGWRTVGDAAVDAFRAWWKHRASHDTPVVGPSRAATPESAAGPVWDRAVDAAAGAILRSGQQWRLTATHDARAALRAALPLLLDDLAERIEQHRTAYGINGEQPMGFAAWLVRGFAGEVRGE